MVARHLSEVGVDGVLVQPGRGKRNIKDNDLQMYQQLGGNDRDIVWG